MSPGLRQAEPPLVSSSFCTEEVRASRIAVFGELCGAVRDADRAAAHLAYHASHRPERGPHSTCMHRQDASTVSFSSIEVDGTRVRFHYAPHSPCRGVPDQPLAVLSRPGP